MRWLLLSGLVLVAGCGHEELAVRPADGIDLSGEWKLNVADSDDPMRLTQAALASASSGPGGTTAGNGGRSQRQRGAGLGPGGPLGPFPPPIMTLDEALRWPARDLTVIQGSGSVTFRSSGRDEVCRPGADHGLRAPRPKEDPRSHDADRGRGDAPPPRCGWDADSLILQPRDSGDDHPLYEQAFSLSEDHKRLIEVVTFHGGRSNGFTASRVWDRVTVPAGP